MTVSALRLLGLTVLTDLDIPAASVAAPSAPIDLEVLGARGEDRAAVDGSRVVAELASRGRRAYSVLAHAEGWTLEVHGVCVFEISADLATVRWRAVPGVADALVSVLAAGTLVALVCRLRGECVLHASAVAVQGQVWGLFGASGTGKSTVAALLASTGADLVTDDVLRVTTPAPVHVVGSVRELRLRRGARSVVDRFAGRPAERATADGRLAIRPPSTAVERLPLGMLVAPVPVEPGRPVTADRLEPAAATVALTAVDRVLGWRDPDRIAEHFTFAADLAQHVPVVRLCVPWQRPIAASLGNDVRMVLERAARQATAEHGGS